MDKPKFHVGRKAGTPNKKKSFRAAVILARKNISPVEQILAVIPQLEPAEQVKAWKYLHEFVDVRPTALKDADEKVATIDDQFEDLPTAELLEMVKRDK